MQHFNTLGYLPNYQGRTEIAMLDTKSGDIDKRAHIARALAKEGFDDVLVLDRESAREILTDRRIELLHVLRTEEIKSIRDLADRLERDKGDVSRDVTILAKHNLVELVTKGRRKVPQVKHETVIVEPVL